MVNITEHPVTVDGVRLDTLAWGIETSGLRLGGLRSGNALLAGMDGEVPSLEDSREPSAYTLRLFVLGTDEDGTVPFGSSRVSELRANLDELLHLFARTHRLIDLRETIAPGVQRQAWAKVIDAIEPEIEPGQIARLTVALTIPGCYWRDVEAATWSRTGAVAGTAYRVTHLTGTTAPVDDAVALVRGPVTNPTVNVLDEDGSTLAWVRLNEALPAGSEWRVNCATWASRVGTALAIDSADDAGSDRTALTDHGGRYPGLLRLSPVRVGGERIVQVSLTGTGFTAETGLAVRARGAYL